MFPSFRKGLAAGDASRGPRILDFVQDGDEWLLTVEGEGGVDETIFLKGQPVETDDGRIRQLQGTEEWSLEIPFPPSAPRVARTLRLRKRDLEGCR